MISDVLMRCIVLEVGVVERAAGLGRPPQKSVQQQVSIPDARERNHANHATFASITTTSARPPAASVAVLSSTSTRCS